MDENVTPLVGVWIEMLFQNGFHVPTLRHSPCGSVDWNLCLSVCYLLSAWSLPLWECGLKSALLPVLFVVLLVTPLVGVWIEIAWLVYPSGRKIVTPLVGVWIEINQMLLPYRGRSVTPLVGVWIEILTVIHSHLCTTSLPLWECGLKSFTLATVIYRPGHSPCGSVDWNNGVKICPSGVRSHSPCGSVDWNLTLPLLWLVPPRHSPCGSVDWNIKVIWIVIVIIVTPLVGVWIEISSMFSTEDITMRHSPCGSVDWNIFIRICSRACSCHSPCGSVDWNTLTSIAIV